MKTACGLFIILLASFASGQTGMAMAEEAYQHGDFLLAQSHLEKTIDEVPRALIEFNLGNCEFRLGHMDLAIWHYQRAKLEALGNALVENNLGLAQRRLGLVQGTKVSSMSTETVLDRVPIQVPLGVFLLLQTFALVGMILCRKRGFLFLALLLILVGNVGWSVRQWSQNQPSEHSYAVVLQPGGTVKGAPDHRGAVVEKLDPGTLIEASVASERWVRVYVGHQWGWINRQALKFLKP